MEFGLAWAAGQVSLPVDLLATWGKQKKVTVQLRDEKGEKGKNGSVTLSAEWQPLQDGGREHKNGIVDVGVYSAMNVPNMGPYVPRPTREAVRG